MSDETPPPAEFSGRNQEGSSKSNNLTIVPDVPMQSLAVADQIQGLATSHSKSFGGEVTAKLIASSVQQISDELREYKAKLHATQERLSDRDVKVTLLTTDNAVLRERISNFKQIKNFSNIGMALGVGIVGFGIDGVRGNYKEVGIGLLVLGLVLCILSLLSSPKEGSK